MRSLLTTLYEEVASTIKRPWRVLGVLNKDRLSQHLNTLSLRHSLRSLRSRVGESWVAYDGDRNFTKREYSNYDDYLAHQKDELQRIDLSEYDIKYRRVLRERLEKLDISWHGKTVLCLAARLGTEVRSFLDIGCFAVGIDLNPGEDNPYVLYGDFHNLQFPTNSVDVVFTNALDHAFDVERLIAEIKRVLNPNGLFIIEAMRGSEEGKSPAFYESFWWSKVDDIVSLLENSRFRLVRRSSFDYPWGRGGGGEQLCLESEE